MDLNVYLIAGGALLSGAVVMLILALVGKFNRSTRKFLFLGATIDMAIGIGLILYGSQQAGIFDPEIQQRQRTSEIAQEFMAGPGKLEPLVSDPGSGIKLYGDAFRFYTANRAAIPAEQSAQWEKWTTLPERPARLLSRSEEITYAEHAKELRTLIQGMAAD